MAKIIRLNSAATRILFFKAHLQIKVLKIFEETSVIIKLLAVFERFPQGDSDRVSNPTKEPVKQDTFPQPKTILKRLIANLVLNCLITSIGGPPPPVINFESLSTSTA